MIRAQGLIFDTRALDFSSSPSVSSSCVFSLVFSLVMSVFSPFSYLTSCLLLGGCGSLFVVLSFVSLISSVLILFRCVSFSPIFCFQPPGHPFRNMQLPSIYTAEHQLTFFALCFPASVVFFPSVYSQFRFL